LPRVLDGCETSSLTDDEHSIRVSEARVLRKTFGPKRHEVNTNARSGASWFVLIHKAEQIKLNELSGVYGTKEGKEEYLWSYGGNSW